MKRLFIFLVVLGLIALVLFPLFAFGGMAVMVDSNGVVYYPVGFFSNNDAVGNGFISTNLQAWLDARFMQGGALIPAEQIVTTGIYSRITGNNLEALLSSIDALFSADTGTSMTVNNYYSSTNSGPTNATDIHVQFSPSFYSPANASAEEHLRAIDSRLGYLAAWLATNVSPSTATLASVAITGANLARENTTEAYTLTATMSDGTSSNVSTAATWEIVGPAPAGTSMATNNLIVGGLVWDTNITIRGLWTYRGISRDATKLVTLDDTNEPSLSSVVVLGTNSVVENGTAQYTAWAVWSSGTSNNVTSTSSWGFAGSTPTNTSISNGALTAGTVSTATLIRVTAQYAAGGNVRTGTNAVTIQNTNQTLQLIFGYSGVYTAGTLKLDCYNNAKLGGWPVWSGQISGYDLVSHPTVVTQLPSQVQGQTWWFVWVDLDGNGILNGVSSSARPWLRIDEPGAIATGQTATNGVILTSNQQCTVSFSLTDTRQRFPRQGWLSSDGCSLPRKKISVVNASVSGGPLAMYTTFTNRNYFCDQDWLINDRGPITNYCGYILYIRGQNTDGSTCDLISGEFLDIP